MRKTYTVTTKTSKETNQEKTYYEIVKEDKHKTVIGTILPVDIQEFLKELSNDVDNDPLLNFFAGSGDYELTTITIKGYSDDATSVRLYFKEVD